MFVFKPVCLFCHLQDLGYLGVRGWIGHGFNKLMVPREADDGLVSA